MLSKEKSIPLRPARQDVSSSSGVPKMCAAGFILKRHAKGIFAGYWKTRPTPPRNMPTTPLGCRDAGTTDLADSTEHADTPLMAFGSYRFERTRALLRGSRMPCRQRAAERGMVPAGDAAQRRNSTYYRRNLENPQNRTAPDPSGTRSNVLVHRKQPKRLSGSWISSWIRI